jgi:hypothetical protein
MDKEYIKGLVENKAEYIELKKAAVKYCKGGVSATFTGKSALKGLYSNSQDKLERTIIGNTYNWMDSHDDVHVKGCFVKTISERKDKIFHLHDHEFKRTAKVGNFIDIYEKDVSWKDLNINKSGNTTALHGDSEILRKYNEIIFDEYKNDLVDQHSVGMWYIKIDLAVNDEDYEDEYKNWNEVYDKLGNPEKADEKGYFWVVREAKLIEISAVLAGSNELTPTLPQKIEPSEDTLKEEAAQKALRELQTYVKLLNSKQ